MDSQLGSSMGGGYEAEGVGRINGTVYQIAKLNNLLPPGFRIELCENLEKIKGLEVKPGKRMKTVERFLSLGH